MHSDKLWLKKKYFVFIIVGAGIYSVGMDTKDKTIAVAMSGGVDSSVAAYLLMKQGYAVHGVFIAIRGPQHVPCTVAEDRQDAMRACASLGIPFLEIDATAAYASQVIEPFVAAYRRGETPNPDVLCNTHIKFGVVYTALLERGFSKIATGHYAQVVHAGGSPCLYRSVDENKDQTYFIYTLPDSVLSTVVFPVGAYTKEQVRGIARKVRLPAAGKRDSVGLCFLGAVSMKEFLSAYLEVKRGEVILEDDGQVVGEHDGAWFYTVGQRHGFSIRDGFHGPFVIVRTCTERNVLFVQHRDTYAPRAKQFLLADTVFRHAPSDGTVARYRHRGVLYPVSVRRDGDRYAVAVFRDPQLIAPGQSVVVYAGDGACIGGGVVQRPVSDR